MKKDRLTTSDEQRERNLIEEQIQRANADAGPSNHKDSPEVAEEGLKRDEGTEKVVLSLSAKPVAISTTPSAPAIGLKLNPLKAANPLKANPLKRPNVFKSATPSSSSSTPAPESDKKRNFATMSAAERLIIEDQERKRRKMERDGTA